MKTKITVDNIRFLLSNKCLWNFQLPIQWAELGVCVGTIVASLSKVNSDRDFKHALRCVKTNETCS